MPHRNRSSRAPKGRWMALKYRGACHICECTLMPGRQAFWDPSDRTTTCQALDCAGAAGLTREKWVGSPISGEYVTVLAESRLFHEAAQ